VVPPARLALQGGSLAGIRQMLDSIPIPLRAILLLLLGAAVILTLSRLLPNLLRRLVASTSLSRPRDPVVAPIRHPRGHRIHGYRHAIPHGPRPLPDSLSLLVGIAPHGHLALLLASPELSRRTSPGTA
jgi:hypothetical protein